MHRIQAMPDLAGNTSIGSGTFGSFLEIGPGGNMKSEMNWNCLTFLSTEMIPYQVDRNTTKRQLLLAESEYYAALLGVLL